MGGRAERPAAGHGEILYGVHPVGEALRAGRRRLGRLWVRPGRRGAETAALRARAEGLGIPVEEAPEEELRRRVPAGANTQGVLLEAGPLPLADLEELLTADLKVRESGAPRRTAPASAADGAPEEPTGERSLVLFLDEVVDPQNVGAIARVAEAAGARGLVLPERRSPPLGPAVSRASAGAVEWLPVARVVNLGRALERAREAGWWVLGADPEAPEDLYALPRSAFAGRVCLVLGAERRGLRPGVLRRVDHLLRVPMAGQVDSLNVAATAAVVCYEWVRRTRAVGDPRA